MKSISQLVQEVKFIIREEMEVRIGRRDVIDRSYN
jgi:hypothetical protein